jgi:hypothetical protein
MESMCWVLVRWREEVGDSCSDWRERRAFEEKMVLIFDKLEIVAKT